MTSPNTTNPFAEKRLMQAHRLRVTRLMLGLTEEQAAAGFRVSLRAYRKYEAGHIPWRGRWGEDFCDKYGVSHCWLWHGGVYGVPSAKNHIAILPAETEKDRISRTTATIMSLLPKNRRDARAILEWAMRMMDIPYRASESEVVQFPKRPGSAPPAA
jgi:hypothetical protein